LLGRCRKSWGLRFGLVESLEFSRFKTFLRG
jgi:hypothetical protein